MLKINDAEFIGLFKVKSGNLRITDPCYDKGTWCSGVLDDCKIGTWETFYKLDDTGNKVSELLAFYSDISSRTLKSEKWLEQSIDVGVDSGQCGIFDDELYPNPGDKKSFYSKCCDFTSSDYAGVVENFGVVSSSGDGDGSYTCYTLEDKDGVVGIKIIFLEKSEDDDYFNDDEDDRDFGTYYDDEF